MVLMEDERVLVEKGKLSMKHPDFLFKYLPVNSMQGLIHSCEIFSNRKVYFPCRTELNDPFEGKGGNYLDGEGLMGRGIHLAADDEHPLVLELMDQYKILALTENGFSPQLWAYYANNYAGMCICFKTGKSFARAKKVKYLSDSTKNSSPDPLDSFYIKEIGWKYESEWRIVEKTDDKFFEFKIEEIACVIYGEKMPKEIQKFISKYIPDSIIKLVAHAGMQTHKVYYQPQDYVKKLDGSTNSEITNNKELLRYLGTLHLPERRDF